MNLITATGLLGGQGRDFSEVYKLYAFRDDQHLSEYLDFIVHEPIEWLKGFPARWLTKGSFSRPKTALVKLLKNKEVITALGDTYISTIYECVWTTFKKHADGIISSREKKNNNADRNILEQMSDEDGPPTNTLIMDDAESVHSVKIHRSSTAAGPNNWERKYRVLEQAYRELIKSEPGYAAASTLILLDALSVS